MTTTHVPTHVVNTVPQLPPSYEHGPASDVRMDEKADRKEDIEQLEEGVSSDDKKSGSCFGF